jgi:excisionase family DNA binding protein
MEPPRLDKLLTYDQLARVLQVNPGTLRNWVSQQFIPHVKLGRAVRFDTAAVEMWLRKRSHPGRLTFRM